MKTNPPAGGIAKGSKTLWAGALLAVVGSIGCSTTSETVKDEGLGTNGGFEHSESGLPVNWLVYSPSTIPTGSYELDFDGSDFKEGRQSLSFAVREASSAGGWHSPGIAQERPAIPGASYRVSFWIKNEGCDYVVTAGGVAPKTGSPEVVDSSQEAVGSWKLVERTISIPPRYENLRFELSIRSPGRLWIDDVRIEPVETVAES